MKPEPQHSLRRNIRLSPESYKQRCAYFVTACIHEKQCLLSRLDGQNVSLTKHGEVVRTAWVDLTNRFAGLALDEYILMPNHLHGILCFVGAGLPRPSSMPNRSAGFSLSDVMRVFKSISTIEVNRAFHTPGRPLWQRSYFDHIIRDVEDMRNHQTYILENPLRWAAKNFHS
jgi:putative transposase